ncbi:hypothetical protein JHK82_041065 [Glycine max]|nr:hypothetical protein JHK85_041736 [Glycine max]KAG5104095.1 hypothetical protein JHK82_041065 [Glycine max]
MGEILGLEVAEGLGNYIPTPIHLMEAKKEYEVDHLTTPTGTSFSQLLFGDHDDDYDECALGLAVDQSYTRSPFFSIHKAPQLLCFANHQYQGDVLLPETNVTPQNLSSLLVTPLLLALPPATTPTPPSIPYLSLMSVITDTTSVLHEAIGYIRFLHDQVPVLCSPYLESSPSSYHQNQHVSPIPSFIKISM